LVASKEAKQLTARMRETHDLCNEYGDVAAESLIETWIDEAERRNRLKVTQRDTAGAERLLRSFEDQLHRDQLLRSFEDQLHRDQLLRGFEDQLRRLNVGQHVP
jgi:hypothetical protein